MNDPLTNDITLLDHTADLGIVVTADSLPRLFEKAVHAMMGLAIDGVRTAGHGDAVRQVVVEAEDLPDLMVRWLGEILYLLDGEHQVVTEVHVQNISERGIEATVNTVPLDMARHEILHEVKAVTYHQIQVLQEDNLWKARVIFDI